MRKTFFLTFLFLLVCAVDVFAVLTQNPVTTSYGASDGQQWSGIKITMKETTSIYSVDLPINTTYPQITMLRLIDDAGNTMTEVTNDDATFFYNSITLTGNTSVIDGRSYYLMGWDGGDGVPFYQRNFCQTCEPFVGTSLDIVDSDQAWDGTGVPDDYVEAWIFLIYNVTTGTSNSPSSLNINSPNNDTITNNANIELIFNASDSDLDVLDCHLFEGVVPVQSIYTVDQVVNQSLNATLTTEQEYVFNIVCDDGTINTTEYLTITYDVTDPTVYIDNPLTANSSLFSGSFNGAVSCLDANLYGFNLTIYDPDNTTIKYGNYTLDINSTVWDWNESIDISLWGDGLHTMIVECSDDHTSNLIDDMRVVLDYVNKALLFNDISIKFLSNQDLNNIVYSKLVDRYTFSFDFAGIGSEQTFIFEIDSQKARIDYRSGSKYDGHFVIDNKYWLDFDGVIGDYNIYQYKGLFRVAITSLSSLLEFKSIGGLNVQSESLTFNVDNTAPVVSLISPLNDTIQTITSTIQNYSFSFNVTDSISDVVNCTFNLNEVENQSRSDITKDVSISFSENVADGESYLFNVSCANSLNLIGESDQWNITFSYTAPTPETNQSNQGGVSHDEEVEEVPMVTGAISWVDKLLKDADFMMAFWIFMILCFIVLITRKGKTNIRIPKGSV